MLLVQANLMSNMCRALVLDSASKEMLLPYSVQVVHNITKLLHCWPEMAEIELKAVPYTEVSNGCLFNNSLEIMIIRFPSKKMAAIVVSM